MQNFKKYAKKFMTWRIIMSECPNCGGTDIAMILYGLPSDELLDSKKVKEKKIVLGGCCVSRGDPKLECNDCGWRY